MIEPKRHWETIGKSDEWYTPKYIFDALSVVFDEDVAAPKDRTHCHVPSCSFHDEDSLDKKWSRFIWMNPPFGGRNGVMPWLEKFFAHGNGICLVADRTSAKWWHYALNRADAVLFINGRVKFIRPDGTVGDRPANGVTLFGIGDAAVSALMNAQINGLGRFLKTK